MGRFETGSTVAWAKFLLVTCTFLTGACGLVLEYIQATIASFILGNSIEQWSVVIGLMLFMMGIGSKAQRFVIGDKHLVNAFIGIEITLAVVGAWAPLGTYAAYAYITSHFMLVQYGFIMLIGFLIGLEIPVVTRINKEYTDELKINLDYILSADYFGSLAGALLFAFVLLRYFPLTESSFIASTLNFIPAMLAFAFFYKHGKVSAPVRLLLVSFLVFISLLVGFKYNHAWNFKLEQHLYDDRIIYSNTTRYQHLVVTHNPTLNEHRFYINGHIQFSSTDEARYHESLVHPAMNVATSRKNILILGGGDGMTLREVLKYNDVQSVDLIDLDPEMVKLCANNPVLRRLNHGAFDDARVKVADSKGIETGDWYYLFQETGKEDEHKQPDAEKVATLNVINIDAEKFVSNAKGRYNIILIDLPDPSTIELNKLYTKGFYSRVKRLLTDGGVIAIQSTSPFFARESYWCISRTVRAAGLDVVNYHVNIESFGDWGFVLATKSLKKGYVDKLILEMDLNNIDTKFLTADVFRASMVFGKDMMKIKKKEINTLMRPVLHMYYLKEDWQYE
ncbi:MAG: polyamine aminopropyltransferase [Proteobacteria bacterium]|nr:polyamine aminopropyltransferase [Pseudomonadota bacterium]